MITLGIAIYCIYRCIGIFSICVCTKKNQEKFTSNNSKTDFFMKINNHVTSESLYFSLFCSLT